MGPYKNKPCYLCNDREIHCHSTCPDYLNYKTKNEQRLKNIRKANAIKCIEYDLRDNRYRSCMNILRFK